MLKWPQRMAITISLARGVQFLHTGVAPGIYGNSLKISNILLDESLSAKISSYNIPLPSKVRMDLNAPKTWNQKFTVLFLLLTVTFQLFRLVWRILCMDKAFIQTGTTLLLFLLLHHLLLVVLPLSSNSLAKISNAAMNMGKRKTFINWVLYYSKLLPENQ